METKHPPFDPADEKILAEYAKTGRATGRRAEQLLRRPEARDRVRDMQKELSDSLVIGRDWVLLRAVELFRRCSEEKPVYRKDPSTKEYVATGETEFDCAGALRALRFIADITGGGGEASFPVIDDMGGDGE